MNDKYFVLNAENVEFIIEQTGATETQIREKFEESVKFGYCEVFWKQFNRWFSVRVAEEYVYHGLLPRVMEEAMRVVIKDGYGKAV